MIVAADLPCNCRACHVCAILGIAYPLPTPAIPVSVPVPAPEPEPRAKPAPRPKRKPAATLFDALTPEPAAA